MVKGNKGYTIEEVFEADETPVSSACCIVSTIFKTV